MKTRKGKIVKKKQKFTQPHLEVVAFENEDVIKTSGDTGEMLPGEDNEGGQWGGYTPFV